MSRGKHDPKQDFPKSATPLPKPKDEQVDWDALVDEVAAKMREFVNAGLLKPTPMIDCGEYWIIPHENGEWVDSEGRLLIRWKKPVEYITMTVMIGGDGE